MREACLKKVASLLFCAVVVLVGCCLVCPVVVVDATAVAWYVDGATLVDWGSGSLVVSNATDFQLLNSNISETKLELDLTSMAELSLRPPLSAGELYAVVSLTIRNTTFFENSQLWLVGGSDHSTVRFDILVEGCTFSESLFALMDLCVAHGSRFRFINNRMTRTTAMGGSTNFLHQTHALWEQNAQWRTTANILCLLHNVTVADRSDFLIQDSSFDVNVPVGPCIGIMSTGGVVVEAASVWSAIGLTILADAIGGSSDHSYGLLWWGSSVITSNNSSHAISGCNLTAISRFSAYAYSMDWYLSDSITSNNSIYSISGCNVSAVSSGSSLYAYGMYWSSSSTSTTNYASYSISGCNVTASGIGSTYVYGMLWYLSSIITSDHSTYFIDGCNLTALSSGAFPSHAMIWESSSSAAVSDYSAYVISACSLQAKSSGSSKAYGLTWSSSPTALTNYSVYSINGCNVTAISVSAPAYGMYWLSSSTSTADYATYSISGCNVTAYNSATYSTYGFIFTSSSTITSSFSTYSISGCDVTASSGPSDSYVFMHSVSDTVLSSGSVFRLDNLAVTGGSNKPAITAMSLEPKDDPLGYYLSNNDVLVDQDIGVPLSGAYRHSRCNRKLGRLLSGQTEPCNDTSCGSLPMHCHPQFTESTSFSNGSCVCSCKNATQLLAITAPPTVPTIESAEWLVSLLNPSCYPLVDRSRGRGESLMWTPSGHNNATPTSSSTVTRVQTQTGTRVPSATVVPRPSVTAILPQSRTSHRSTVTAEHDTVRTASVSCTSSTLYRGGKVDDRDNTHTPVEDSARPPVASDTVSTVAEVLGSETAAEAVVGTGAASVAVAGLVTSPAGASQAVRLGAIAGAIECSYTDDDVVPSLFEHPFQISLGDGPLKVYVGSTLVSTLVFIAMPWLVIAAMCVYGLKAAGADLNPTLRKVQTKILSNFAIVSLAYMGPVMCKSFVLVVAHDPTATDVAVVSVCVLVALCAVAVVAWAVLRRGKKSTSSTGREEGDDAGGGDDEVEMSRGQQVFEATFGLLFDGCRNLSAPVRASYLVEVGCTSLLMMLDGIRPGEKNCSKVAAAMAAVSLILLLYFCIARPFRARLELFFAVATSTLLFALGVLAYLSNLLRDDVTLQPPEWALTAFGYVAVAESIAFFLQAAVLAGWAYTRAQRRQVLRRQAEVERARAGGGGGDPLLGDVPMADLKNSDVKVPAGTGTIDFSPAATGDDTQHSMLLNPLLQPQSDGP